MSYSPEFSIYCLNPCVLFLYNRWPYAPISIDNILELPALGFDVPTRATQTSLAFGSLARFSNEILVQIFGQLPAIATYLNLKIVSKRLHDLVSDAKFTLIVLREMLKPDPAREMFWVHPIGKQPGESENFRNALNSWLALTSSPGKEVNTIPEDILFDHEFPLIQFVHALYTGNSSRNRKRLWKNVKSFEDTWGNYRRSGWKVNRFGAPYPVPQKE